MQNELLAKYPKADVRVYAVWFSMFPGDARDRWPRELLTDSRVMHRWDEPKAVGTFFGSNKAQLQPRLTADSNGTGGEVLWDSYLLYGPDARWDHFPTGLRHWGRTIVAARGTLAKQFERMFAASATEGGSNEYANRDAQRHAQQPESRRPVIPFSRSLGQVKASLASLAATAVLTRPVPS